MNASSASTNEQLSPLRSPHSMAKAALEAAVEEQHQKKRKRQSCPKQSSGRGGSVEAAEQAVGSSVTESSSGLKKLTYVGPTRKSNDDGIREEEVEHQIQSVWEEFESEVKRFKSTKNHSSQPKEVENRMIGDIAEAAVEATGTVLGVAFDLLVREGLNAFCDLEGATRNLASASDLSEARLRELHRLQESEQENREAFSNLLRAVETSKREARDSSRAAQIEASLRREITSLRTERDEAMASCSEKGSKCKVLEDEIQLLKAKLARVSQDKIKVERDSRAAMSLARSLDSHASSDTDFYKRKVAELNDRLQSQQTHMADQKLKIEEMRHQIEKSMSQNRLAQLRHEGRGSKSSAGRRSVA